MTKRRKAFTALSAIAVLLIGVAAMFLLTSFKAEAAKTEQIVEIRTTGIAVQHNFARVALICIILMRPYLAIALY